MSATADRLSPAAPPQARAHREIWRVLAASQARYPVLQVTALIGVAIYGDLSLDGFATVANLKLIVILASLIGLAAAGQTLVVLLGGFDLSVAGFIVVGAVAVTEMTSKYSISAGVAIIAAIAFSGILGGLSGWLCHRFRVQPLIITLAMGSIAIGAMQVQTGQIVAGSAPLWLGQFTSTVGTTFGLAFPPLIVLWIVVIVALGIFLHRTAAGRRLSATGANPRAAEYALVHTRRVWTGVFALSAIGAAIVGILLAGFAGNFDASLGNPYLFECLAAVIIGGTVFGGPGDYTRSALGALLLTVLTTVLVGHGLDAADEQIMDGVVILLFVAAYGRQRRVRDRV